MRNIKTLIAAMLFSIFALTTQVNASPAINTMNVQGYMKLATGNPVTDGSYDIAYGVFQNGVAIWGKQISTTVTDGLFSASLSGLGTNLAGLPGATGMNANYAAVTLNPALLQAAATGAITIRIYAVDPIDGSNPTFDVAYSAVPSAYYSEIAKSVDDGSVSFAGLATAAYASVGGIGSADLLVQFNSAGYLDSSVFAAGTLDASSLTGTFAGVVVPASVISGSITNTIVQTGTAGITTGTGAVALNGNTTVSGTATLNGNTTVSGTTTLNGATAITGATTVSGGITTTGLLGITVNSGGITINSGGLTLGATSMIVHSVKTVAGTPQNALPHDNYSIVVLTTANTVLNGIAAGVAGQKLTIWWVNVGTTASFITNNNAGAAVGNKIFTNTGANVTGLNAGSGASATFIYLTTSQGVANNGWYLISGIAT